jgi:hypothetical protein
MKFKVLDDRLQDDGQSTQLSISNTYQYLDDLLDKTFLADYFIERRSTGTAAVATAAATATAAAAS